MNMYEYGVKTNVLRDNIYPQKYYVNIKIEYNVVNPADDKEDMGKLKTRVSEYMAKVKAKNLELVEYYYDNVCEVEIFFDKEIKSFKRVSNNIISNIREINHKIGNERFEIITEQKESAMEIILINEDVSEKVNTCYVTKGYRFEVKRYDSIVRCYRLDKYNNRVQYLEKEIYFFMDKKEFEKMLEVGTFQLLNRKNEEFNPELTAIAINNSKSAEMLKEVATSEDKILDYGCGTGRNMEFIHNELGVPVDGTDIPQQLEKEKKRHDKLRDLGMTIEASELIENGFYDYILNTHVLNVISSDEVKKMVLVDMYKKLKPNGQAFIEVRTKSDVEGAKTKEKFGDGWRIKKGSKFTYQEAISKEKMVNMLTEIGFKIKEHIFNSNRHIVVACK